MVSDHGLRPSKFCRQISVVPLRGSFIATSPAQQVKAPVAEIRSSTRTDHGAAFRIQPDESRAEECESAFIDTLLIGDRYRRRPEIQKFRRPLHRRLRCLDCMPVPLIPVGLSTGPPIAPCRNLGGATALMGAGLTTGAFALPGRDDCAWLAFVVAKSMAKAATT
jgi:hypothetical protein